MSTWTSMPRFNNKDLMRAHWLKCHNIELTEVFKNFVVPGATIEPTPKLNIMGEQKPL